MIGVHMPTFGLESYAAHYAVLYGSLYVNDCGQSVILLDYLHASPLLS